MNKIIGHKTFTRKCKGYQVDITLNSLPRINVGYHYTVNHYSRHIFTLYLFTGRLFNFMIFNPEGFKGTSIQITILKDK